MRCWCGPCYTGISRGTESLVFRGGVPASEHERMRAPFQSGDFPGPVKYGYLNVGLVEGGPSELVGHTVFTLYPHQSAFVVPAVSVAPIPDGVPARRAVLAGPSRPRSMCCGMPRPCSATASRWSVPG